MMRKTGFLVLVVLIIGAAMPVAAQDSDGITMGDVFSKDGYHLLGRLWWDMGFSVPGSLVGIAGMGAGFVNEFGFYFLGNGYEVGNAILGLGWQWHGQGMLGLNYAAEVDPDSEDAEFLASWHTANILWLHGLLKTGEENESYMKGSLGFGLYDYNASIMGAEEGVDNFHDSNAPGLAFGAGTYLDGVEVNLNFHVVFGSDEKYNPHFFSFELKLFQFFARVLERSQNVVLRRATGSGYY